MNRRTGVGGRWVVGLAVLVVLVCLLASIISRSPKVSYAGDCSRTDSKYITRLVNDLGG